MKRRKIVMLILGVVLAVGVAVTLYIIKEYNRIHKDTADLKPDYSVSAANMLQEFQTEEQSSNKKYWDKVVQVDGVVKDVSKDEKGFYSVIMGEPSSMSSVRCSMDSIHNHEAEGINKGSLATIRGICAGFNADELLGSDIILVRCVVIPQK